MTNSPSRSYIERCVMPEVRRMLKSLEIHTQTYWSGEYEAMKALAGRGPDDLELPLVQAISLLLGARPSKAKEERFDVTRRSHRKKTSNGLRGVPRALRHVPLKEAQQALKDEAAKAEPST